MLVKRARDALNAEAKYQDELDAQVEHAMSNCDSLGFSVCFVSRVDFMTGRRGGGGVCGGVCRY